MEAVGVGTWCMQSIQGWRLRPSRPERLKLPPPFPTPLVARAACGLAVHDGRELLGLLADEEQTAWVIAAKRAADSSYPSRPPDYCNLFGCQLRVHKLANAVHFVLWHELRGAAYHDAVRWLEGSGWLRGGTEAVRERWEEAWSQQRLTVSAPWPPCPSPGTGPARCDGGGWQAVEGGLGF